MTKPIQLTYDHFDEAWSIIESQDHYMTIPREQIQDASVWSKSYWLKYFEDGDPNYRMYGTFLNDELVYITTMHLWSVMPYATSGAVITKDTLTGKNFLRTTVTHNRYLMDTVMIEEGRKKAYWVSGHLAPKARKVMGGDKWLYCHEDHIPAGEVTKWRGFSLLTGTKTWPIDLNIHSFTWKGDDE
jgi:hypothetical protein